MADPIRYLRLTALPSVWLSDALYFIGTEPDEFDFYVTGNDAIPRQLGKGPIGPKGDDGDIGKTGLQGVPGQRGVAVVAAVPLGGHRAITVFGQYVEPGDEDIIAGITTGAVTEGETTFAVRDGIITEPSWSWVPDQPIFLASFGVLTQSPPTLTRIRRVAWALTSTTINVDFYPAIELT